MKKTISLILVLLFFILSFAGCSSESDNNSEQGANNHPITVEVIKIKPKDLFEKSSYINGYGPIKSYYYVCECTTVSGDSIYMFIGNYAYMDNFDSTISNGVGGYSTTLPESIDFVNAVKISVYFSTPEETFENTYTYSYINEIFRFDSVNVEEVEAAKIQNQEPIEFTDGAILKQPVYAKLKNIQAIYEVTNDNFVTGKYTKFYVCKSECANGQEIWVCVDSLVYKTSFLDTTGVVLDVSPKIDLDNLKIYGNVILASELSDDLVESIGDIKLLLYSHR